MGSIIRCFLMSALTAAGCASLLPAQHVGGGHGSAHGGFSGGLHSSSGSGFHSASSSFGHSGTRFGSSSYGSSVYSRSNSLPPPASGISPYAWSQIQRGNRRGYRHVPYGYFFAPYYYPFLGYDSSTFPSYDDQAYAEDPGPENMAMTQGSLGQQMQMLSDQISQLRDAQQRGTIPAGDDVQQKVIEVPVTIVLRSGQQLQVENYAIMGQTFWDFTRQPARKIPLSTIDIAASTRATESKGGEFPQLTANP